MPNCEVVAVGRHVKDGNKVICRKVIEIEESWGDDRSLCVQKMTNQWGEGQIPENVPTLVTFKDWTLSYLHMQGNN